MAFPKENVQDLSSSQSTLMNSPVLMLLLINKAMRNGLAVLHRSMMGCAGGEGADIRAAFEYCNLLKLIFENYVNAKDEVILPAVDAKTYFLQHQSQKRSFDHLLKMLISSIQKGGSFPSTELVCLVGSVQNTVSQCMVIEEEQIIPLLIEKYSFEEQASLVWQLLCSIPANVVVKFIRWLASSISADDCQHLHECLRTIAPEDKLLQQVFFTWMEGKDSYAVTTANRTYDTYNSSDSNGLHPIDDVVLWHNAIEKELKETLAEAKKIAISGPVTNNGLLTFCDRLKFIADICRFHSISQETIIYPAVYGQNAIFEEHRNEDILSSEFKCLIESVKAAGTISSTVAEFHPKICSHADQIIEILKQRFHDEQAKVLPLVRKHLSIDKQSEILYQSLCVMPLKLTERALPWLMNSLTANQSKNFVQNMQLAAPESDVALVQMFCFWARKASKKLCSSNSVQINSTEPSSSVQETCKSFLGTEIPAQPINVVFTVHKAIRRDLDYLDTHSERLGNCDQIFLQQFIKSFCLLRDLYIAHSNAEDCVVYPALESKGGLRNVCHYYTLDHKQEQHTLENISCLLLEMAKLHGTTKSCPPKSECLREYNTLATRLRIILKSLRVIIDEHMYREELEVWPLFGVHFSVEEQNKIIGFILGTTGAEMLRVMLPWVASALTEDELSKMMETFKQVTKSTMFNEWLDESSKGTSFSTLQPKLETSITVKGTGCGESERKSYRTSNTHRRKNLKHQMTSYWIAAQRTSPTATGVDNEDNEEQEGQSPTFRDDEKNVYGCNHYKRNCKLRAACCGKLFTCSFCHDKMSNHTMDRKATSEMMCMQCLSVQPIGPMCATASCNGFPMAKYYCNTCKLFDDERNVYHCPFCNLCRVGKGLGIDYFHCMSCNCCLAMNLVNHKCREKCLETNCPICNEFLFTSTSSIKPLPCGHHMHFACFKACTQSNGHYTCAVCSKSSAAAAAIQIISTHSSLPLDGDGTIEFYRGGRKIDMTSCTDINPEGRFFSFAGFLVNLLYHIVLWFEHHNGRLVVPKILGTIKRRLESGVAGQKAKERCLLCFVVLCALVLFFVLSTLLILFWFKALGRNKYIYPL